MYGQYLYLPTQSDLSTQSQFQESPSEMSLSLPKQQLVHNFDVFFNVNPQHSLRKKPCHTVSRRSLLTVLLLTLLCTTGKCRPN